MTATCPFKMTPSRSQALAAKLWPAWKSSSSPSSPQPLLLSSSSKSVWSQASSTSKPSPPSLDPERYRLHERLPTREIHLINTSKTHKNLNMTYISQRAPFHFHNPSHLLIRINYFLLNLCLSLRNFSILKILSNTYRNLTLISQTLYISLFLTRLFNLSKPNKHTLDLWN